MKQFLIDLGHKKAVIAITLMSEVLVLLVTVGIELLLPNGDIIRGMLVATCVTFIVAPFISWFLVDILIRLHQLEQEMRELATYDELTGLLRRRAFFEQSDHLQKLAIRDGAAFCVIMIDIDNFKQVNDRYGHAAGDKLLVSFSKVAHANFRESDLVSRFGGDEFVFFLPDTSLEQALKILERLRVALNAVNQSNGLPIEMTISIGLVCNTAVKTQQVDDFINAADKALYRAKECGGNQIQIYRAAADQLELPIPQVN